MYHQKMGLSTGETGESKWDCAKVVLAKVVPFYDKANIPMFGESIVKKIIKLLDDNKKLRTIPMQRRETPSTISKLEDMKMRLDKTFVL